MPLMCLPSSSTGSGAIDVDMKDFNRFGKAAQQQILRKLAEQTAQNNGKGRNSSRGATRTENEGKNAARNSNRVYPPKNGRESKYHARPTARMMPNGTVRVFASRREALRYDELRILLAAGKITDLRIQPQFTLLEGYVNEDGEVVRAERYVADFSYKQDGVTVVEDVKGKRTDVYRIKRKQVIDKFGIVIREV